MVAAWIAQLARGILAVALGVTITLTLEHTPAFGLISFGVFALLAGAALLVGTLRGDYADGHRRLFVAQAVVTLAAAIVALVLAPSAGVATFGILVGVWAIVAGLLEGATGLLARGTSPLARDWIITGAVTIVLGVVALVLPPDIAEAFAGENGAAGVLTSSVILVGIVGAWAIIVGVLQAISAVSIRTPRATPAVVS